MRRLAVIHHRHMDWVPTLRTAEPRLDIRGCHPRDLGGMDAAWLAEAEGLFCWKLPAGLAGRMPRLTWVQNSGAGVDHLVNHPELPAHIPITRADGSFGLWMARYVCGHLLQEAQRIDACREAQAAALWKPALIPEDLTGRSALVVGFGRIGHVIARALRELGLDVTGLATRARTEDGFTVVPWSEGPARLPQARLLVLCAPLTPATRGLVDATWLTKGHSGLTLVNVGRGELLELGALRDALDTGRVGRAVLDVFPEEPLPADHWLWRHPQITVTPHHSGPSTPAHLIPDIQENLTRFAEGRPIVQAVDRVRGY
ncbi:MAG TPA: NAD(P)-dependent oxidoreductase [Holophagaceae bacterium]|nr:NAD(P)-dependent oxidoreductase [Holophagaceae bacterium]